MTDAISTAASRRLWRVLAGTLASAVVAVTVFSVLLWMADGMRPLPVTYGRSALGVIGLVLAPLCYAAVGWVLAGRIPGNPIGWIFLAAGMSIGSMLPVNLMVAAVLESLRPASPVVIALAWGRTVFAVPVVLSLLIIAALIFPNGRPLPGRWRYAVWAATTAGVILAIATAADPRGLPTYPSIPNPTALPYDFEPLVAGLRIVAVGFVVPALGAAMGSVWSRYRHGDAVVRAQLRWIALGVGISAVLVVPYLVIRYVVQVSNDLGELLATGAQLGSCAFPVAAAFAISRYRLYEVDILIGRTLVYLPLSATLGGLYTAGIALFQRLFVAITGETSDLAIVMAILVVASAFTPLRKWLESVVDQRFPASTGAGPLLEFAGSDAARRPDVRPLSITALLADPPADLPEVQRRRVGGMTFAQLVPVDATGTVECPLRSSATVRDCLTCPYLSALARHPQLTVVCQPPI